MIIIINDNRLNTKANIFYHLDKNPNEIRDLLCRCKDCLGLLVIFDKVEKKKYSTKICNNNSNQCQYDTQSPANPPLVQPYPYYDNYEQMQDLKHFYMACNRGFKLFAGQIDKAFVYTDHPYRENINSIDQLLVRAKEYSCSQNLKFHTINEYIKQQQSIPQSVYKQIREIHQQQMEVNSPIIPKL